MIIANTSLVSNEEKRLETRYEEDVMKLKGISTRAKAKLVAPQVVNVPPNIILDYMDVQLFINAMHVSQ